VCRWVIVLVASCVLGWAQKPSLTIDAGHPGAKISPSLYGIFFEEINHSGDGGLYAELIRNRSFEEQTTEAWSLRTSGVAKARMSLDQTHPLNDHNKAALRVEIQAATSGAQVAILNEGFWGIGVRKGEKYNVVLYARSSEFPGQLEVRIESGDGKVYAAQKIGDVGSEWKRYTAVLESSDSDPRAQFALVASAPGTVWLDVVSLFPAKTWKDRPNGLRPDLAQMLTDLKPAFLRFPGGCYVEGGNYLRNAFRWKTTVTDIADRPGHLNDIWGYYSTDGLGFHEYLQLAEDLGAEPMYDVNVGMAHREAEPLERMNEWVQEALDAIEYANGPVTSRWGAVRAKNGHPAPFNLKYVEIGNENGGPRYAERYPLLYKAIKLRYPNMLLIANYMVDTAPVDILDQHIYSNPERMRAVAGVYDNYDRKQPPVFVGEYANNRGVGKGNLAGALSEASYMLGFERNADVVIMAAYAPLFYHVEDRRWPVNLIGFDSQRVFGTPSYWVQWLFAHNRGDVVLPAKLDVEKAKIKIALDRGGIGLGTANSQAEFKDLRVTQGDKVLLAADFSQGMWDWRSTRGDWNVENGVYRQVAMDVFARSMHPNPDWTDYSMTLKVRRTAGTGIVQLLVRSRDPGSAIALNLGGSGALASLQRMANGASDRLASVPGNFEDQRWYDVRVDVNGPRVQAFLDGKPVIDVANSYGEITLPAMEVAASKVAGTGEIVVKVVNFTNQPQQTDVRLDGVDGIAGDAVETVLTSASPEDENTVDQPRKVAPQTRNAPGLGKQFRYTFAPNSMTVLRLKTRT
jgi:alpha-L-arabinofuranosidase